MTPFLTVLPPARRWCFTVNNPHAQLGEEDALAIKCRYLVSGFEKGESGTFHLQCYAEFSKPVRRSALIKYFGKCHFEVARGSAVAASEYCKKGDGTPACPIDADYFEFGELEGVQGRRNDILSLRDRLLAGDDDDALLRNDDTASGFFKYQRGIAAARVVLSRPAPRDEVRVGLFYGPPGTGKSSFARELFPDAYWKDNTKWWGYYTGQKTVIWDEFTGASCTPSDYNRIFDRYPYQVEYKGGGTPLLATQFIIISNYTPASWWNVERSTVKFDAVKRRIHGVFWFRKLGEDPEEFTDYDLFDAALRGDRTQ